MKKEKYSSAKGEGKKPAHSDDKKQSRIKGPSEASMNKVSIANHKQVSGTAEMLNSAPSSAKHSPVKGPSEMKQDKLGSAASLPNKAKESGSLGYLGKLGGDDVLKKGFKSLESVKYSSDESPDSNEQDDGVKVPAKLPKNKDGMSR